MPDASLNATVIIPVHNRRDVTLACLRRLSEQGDLAWAAVLVVDDGSNDGTYDAIRREFPAVEILRGDGNWWWAGAVRRGMEHALARGARHIVWLNDDCQPPHGALRALCDLVERQNCVAWIDAITPSGWTYGAHRKTALRMRRCSPPEEQAGRIDAFSGNCVVVPRTWIEHAGLPDDAAFPHGLADFDYGLRLKKAGARLQALPGIVAQSADPGAHSTESWLISPRPMRAIWRDFSSPRSFMFFPAWRRFTLRHWGPLWGWVVFAKPYATWLLIALVRALTPARVRFALSQRKKNPHFFR